MPEDLPGATNAQIARELDVNPAEAPPMRDTRTPAHRDLPAGGPPSKDVGARHDGAGVQTAMSLDDVVARWRPGSYDPPWTWDDEDQEVWSHPHTPALAAQIAADGVQQPVLLGPDGRVWDGHHRICIARRLGHDLVPVEHATDTGATPQ